MKLKITKSDKKALLAALAVCGIGILFSILIVLGVDIYRKHTYTSVILPDAYRITDMKAKEHTSYSVNGDNTDYVYIITVKYEIDGTSYTDTLQILQGTHLATELHARYPGRQRPGRSAGQFVLFRERPVPYWAVWGRFAIRRVSNKTRETALLPAVSRIFLYLFGVLFGSFSCKKRNKTLVLTSLLLRASR